MADHPLVVLVAQGAAYVACLPILRWMHPEPGRHVDAAPEPHPPVYRSLLIVFRLELPASFAVISALEPYLPALLHRLGLGEGWETPAASTWMVSRVLVFALLERWHGWHGRWGLSLAAGVLMVGGFVAAVGADAHGKQELEPALMVRSTVVVDVLAQCVEIGELQHAVVAGLMTPADVHAELSDVVTGRRPGRTRADEVTIFDSSGTALQDVAAALAVYEKARRIGRGQEVALDG